MKHFRKTIVILMMVLILFPTTALAEGETTLDPTVTPTLEPTQLPEVTPLTDETLEPEETPMPEEIPQVSNDALISITPDSVFYPLKLLIESITISLTTDEADKAQLMVKYANRRLLEAEIMRAQDDEELAEKLIKDSLKFITDANTCVQGVTEDKDNENNDTIDEILVDISRVESDVVISMSFTAGQDEETTKFIETVEEEVVKTLATRAFLTAKDNFFDAKDAFKSAQEAYKTAKKSGDEDTIAAAYEALVNAEDQKDAMEDIKDGFESLKEEIKDSYDDDDEDIDNNDQDEDKDDDDDDDRDDENNDDDDKDSRDKDNKVKIIKEKKNKSNNKYKDKHDKDGEKDNDDDNDDDDNDYDDSHNDDHEKDDD